MLNLKTSIGNLKQIFSPVDEIADSCEVRFGENGLYIPAADRMSIAIADIHVDPDSFKKYDADGERVGLQLSKLTDVLSMAEDGDTTNIYLDDENLLHIEVENKESVLGLVSLDSVPKQPGIPDYEYGTTFSIEKSEFDDAVKTAGVFADKIVFEVDEENQTVQMKAEGDIDRTCVTLDKDDFDSQKLRNLENSFSQNYLNDIVSVIPSETIITIRMTESHTMELEYPVIDEGGKVVFTIAPWNEGTT